MRVQTAERCVVSQYYVREDANDQRERRGILCNLIARLGLAGYRLAGQPCIGRFAGQQGAATL